MPVSHYVKFTDLSANHISTCAVMNVSVLVTNKSAQAVTICHSKRKQEKINRLFVSTALFFQLHFKLSVTVIVDLIFFRMRKLQGRPRSIYT